MSRRQRRRENIESKKESPKVSKSASSRRKRSSKKNKKKLKGLWWKGLLGLFLVLLVGGVVVYNRVIAFLHSDSFREKVQLEVGAIIGCETTFGDFEWSGLHASNDSFEATGEGAISKVKVDDINFDVDFDYWKRDKYRIENVKLGKVSTVVDLRKPFLKLELEKSEKGFFEKLLPEKTELVNVDAISTSMRMISEGGDYVVKDTAMDLKHDEGEYVINLSGGEVEIPMNFINKGKLKNARVIVRDDKISIPNSEYRIFDKGSLNLNGEVNLKKDAPQRYSLRGNMVDVELGEIIPKDWKQSLFGNVKSEFTIMPVGGREPRISGKVNIEDGVLRALPVLDTISYYLKNKDFQNIRFKEFRCDFVKYKKQLKITNVYAHSVGLLRVEGNLTIEDRQLKGVFDVGVPPQYLKAIPGAKEIVFKPGKDRMHWAKVNITGSLDDIDEDLTDRLIAAAPLQIFKNAMRMGGEVLGAEGLQERSDSLAKLISENGGMKETFTKLMNGDEGITKEAKKIFGGLGDLLNGGADGSAEPNGENGGGLLEQGGGLLRDGLNLINPNGARENLPNGNGGGSEDDPEKKEEKEPTNPQSGRDLIENLTPF